MTLAACAPPAKTENMVVAAPPVAALSAHSSLRDSVWLDDVRGGQTADAMIKSDVGNSELLAAFTESLRANHLLAKAQHEARFVLAARLLELDQPDSGTDLTVTSKIRYELRAQRSFRPVLAMTVSAPFTAEMKDSVLVFERLRMANEGAIRENIRAFVDRLIRELDR